MGGGGGRYTTLLMAGEGEEEEKTYGMNVIGCFQRAVIVFIHARMVNQWINGFLDVERVPVSQAKPWEKETLTIRSFHSFSSNQRRTCCQVPAQFECHYS